MSEEQEFGVITCEKTGYGEEEAVVCVCVEKLGGDDPEVNKGTTCFVNFLSQR